MTDNVIATAAKNLPGHWFQGCLSDDRGNRCGLGHVDAVIDRLGLDEDTANELSNKIWTVMNDVAGELYPDRVAGTKVTFAAFNDHPDTTEGEVVAVMEKAAVRLDELG